MRRTHITDSLQVGRGHWRRVCSCAALQEETSTRCAARWPIAPRFGHSSRRAGSVGRGAGGRLPGSLTRGIREYKHIRERWGNMRIGIAMTTAISVVALVLTYSPAATAV